MISGTFLFTIKDHSVIYIYHIICAQYHAKYYRIFPGLHSGGRLVIVILTKEQITIDMIEK